MIAEVIETVVEGEVIYIEVERSYGSEETTSLQKTFDTAKEGFEHAKATITSIAKSIAKDINALDEAVTPDEFGLEFAIKFNAGGQVVVAKVGSEATFKVKMTYQHSRG